MKARSGLDRTDLLQLLTHLVAPGGIDLCRIPVMHRLELQQGVAVVGQGCDTGAGLALGGPGQEQFGHKLTVDVRRVAAQSLQRFRA